MKIAQLLNELKQKDFYKSFSRENPDAFFAAGFFVLDDSGEDKYQLDFFIPSKNKIAVAEFPFSKIKIHEDEIANASRLKIAKVDIHDLRRIVDETKKERGIELKINKIIALLKDDLWQLTCLPQGLDILKIHIDSQSGEIKVCEKVNLFHIMNGK